MKQLSNEFAGYILSEATLQEADLLDSAFYLLAAVTNECEIATEVTKLRHEYESLKRREVSYAFCGHRFDTEDKDENGMSSAEHACYLWNEDVFDLLSAIAPEGCYFGASEGDGALFGFWAFCETCGMQTEFPTQKCEWCQEKENE